MGKKHDWSDIVFYFAVKIGAHAGIHLDDENDHDIVYVPRTFSVSQVKNRFKKRNPTWDFKKDNIWIGLVVHEPEVTPTKK